MLSLLHSCIAHQAEHPIKLHLKLACLQAIHTKDGGVVYTPQRIILNDIDRTLLPLGSNAIMAPVLFIFCAMNGVLPLEQRLHPTQPDLLQHLVPLLPCRSRGLGYSSGQAGTQSWPLLQEVPYSLQKYFWHDSAFQFKSLRSQPALKLFSACLKCIDSNILRGWPPLHL